MRIIHQLAQFTAVLSIAIACTPRNVQAQAQTSVSFDSGSQFLFSDSSKTVSTRLTAGNATISGDGAAIRLGYYSMATTSNFFAGTFVPLTGQLSANTLYNTTSIGDTPAGTSGANGTFALILSFSVGNATTGNNLPATGTPLAIQFYNNTTLVSSTAYNAVADALWLWKAPDVPGPTVGISLDQAGLTWLGGASSAFYTSLPTGVPEPSTIGFLGATLAGALGLHLRRRRA